MLGLGGSMNPLPELQLKVSIGASLPLLSALRKQLLIMKKATQSPSLGFFRPLSSAL